MGHDELRAEVYRLLSEVFKQPTPAFVEEQSTLVDCLRHAAIELNYDLTPELYENWPMLASNLSSLTSAFRQSFLFPIESRVVPVESIYRPWTYDSTADNLCAQAKGLFMSDHALHMKALFEDHGLALPTEFLSTPDHLCLELEFAALLLDQHKLEHYAVFIQEHLNWLNGLLEDASRQQIPVYYLQAIKLTAQFLSLELRRPKNSNLDPKFHH